MKTIVVGTDGSASAGLAVAMAADLAEGMGATVHVVIAYRMPVVATAPDMAAVMPSPMELRDAASVEVEAQAATVRARGIETEVHVCDGPAAQVLCDVATAVDADVIVVGDRHMHGAGRLLGSVASRVAHHAPCSVYIARTTG